MLFEKNIPENSTQFVDRVKQISALLNINPDWLMGLMYHESRLNHRIKNSIGATGLIQFMPGTMRGLNVTSQQLISMSNVQQLDYVYLYFKPYANRIKSAYDLFLITFLPIALGQKDDFIFHTSSLPASVIANQNAPFDLNKDGQITLKEYKEYLNTWFTKYGLSPEKKNS